MMVGMGKTPLDKLLDSVTLYTIFSEIARKSHNFSIERAS